MEGCPGGGGVYHGKGHTGTNGRRGSIIAYFLGTSLMDAPPGHQEKMVFFWETIFCGLGYTKEFSWSVFN